MNPTLVSSILVACVLALGAFPPAAGSAELFPEVRGWTLTPREKVYTRENLWDIIDGAAELYLSYNFIDLHIAEYSNARDMDVHVELYRHGSNQDAFGIYSQERNQDYHFIDLGIQGYIEDGVLNFLTGIYYVKISSHRTGAGGREALTTIAREINSHLRQSNRWPDVLALFPPEGREPNSEAYLAENFLGYGFLRSAFVAEYKTETPFRIFIIKLDSAEQTRRMAESYVRAFQPASRCGENGTVSVKDPHNGEVYILLHDRYFCGVLSCTDRKTAENYLKILGGIIKAK
jgi:hypothetical protein